MSRRKAVAKSDGAGMPAENVERMEVVMLQYAFSKPELEPGMLRLARAAELSRVEREILRMRDYAKRRR